MRVLALRLPPTTKEVVLGVGGGLIEVVYAGAAFLYTRREVYEAIQPHWELPVCNERLGKPMVPYFMPMIVQEDESPSPPFDKLTAGKPSPVGSTSSPQAIARGRMCEAARISIEDFSFSYLCPSGWVQNLRRHDDSPRPHRPLRL